MFGLFDDFLQQPLALLQAGDFSLVVPHRARQAQSFVAEGGAGRVRHDHGAQLLLVELQRGRGGVKRDEEILKATYADLRFLTLSREKEECEQ